MNFNKVVIIVSGVSGAGKSTFAKFLEELGGSDDTIICTADDYFMTNEEYKFDATKLGYAHNECKTKFTNALKFEVPLVIVANTNTKPSDRHVYANLAKKYEYTVFSVCMENINGTKGIHNVPPETLMKQSAQLRNSLNLYL